MKPLFHPRLVNDPFGDPALYIDFLFERRAMLFDLGSLAPLSARQLLKVDYAFVSHTYMDHFVGFDSLLRILLGREKTLHLFGPTGFLDQVEHRLASYTWNLVANYESDFVLKVTEVHPNGGRDTARFRTRSEFQRGPCICLKRADGLLVDEETFQVRTAFLDHGIPCLAFSLEEKLHVNVWKSGLEQLGLPTGPWLREVKYAALRQEPESTPFRVGNRDVTLGELKEKVLRVVPGQKVVYVTDATFTAANSAAIVELAKGADLLFIEAAFTHEHEKRAAEKRHLTSRQAGLLAREAGVKRIVPFHFSPKHQEEEDVLIRETLEAFEEG